MIVQRITVHYKSDKVNEALQLLKDVVARTKFPYAVRYYTPKVGLTDVTIGEFEFTDFVDMEAFWAQWNTLPEAKEFQSKYDPLAEPGRLGEIFELHEVGVKA